jgi:hypothetical protein
MTYITLETATKMSRPWSADEYAEMIARDQHREDLEVEQAIQDYYDKNHGA